MPQICGTVVGRGEPSYITLMGDLLGNDFIPMMASTPAPGSLFGEPSQSSEPSISMVGTTDVYIGSHGQRFSVGAGNAGTK